MTFSVPGYRIEQLLGRGSQAEVWSAQRAGTGERVALKRIAVSSPAAAAAARSEAGLLAALDHPSLIQLRDFVALESALVLVLELAEAGSLAHLLQRRGRLSPAEVVASISPVAAALAHAHEAGVLHADVSAANILFTAAGQPKLADLGVARLLAGSGAGLGTPSYLDPVVAAGGMAGAASDVFSLGAVALHALTGSGPWQRPGPATAEHVLAVAATGQVVGLTERLDAFEPGLAAVLGRVLDRQPDRRGTAAEFALDLRAALAPAPVVLAGGRILTRVGRHSVELRQRDAAARSGLAPPNRPADLLADGRVPADLTHVCRPHPRPAELIDPPAGPPWWSPSGWQSRLAIVSRVVRTGRLLAGATILAAALAVLLIGMLLTGSGRRPAAAAPASPATSARPTVAATGAKPDPASILDGLDRLRAQAYGQRQPRLLEQVYGSASLLAQDTAQLAAWVPPGCQLTGLRTSYRDLRSAAAGAGRLEVRVSASLAAGSLSCAGTRPVRTPAVGPIHLVLGLTDDGAGYRIATERQVTGTG